LRAGAVAVAYHAALVARTDSKLRMQSCRGAPVLALLALGGCSSSSDADAPSDSDAGIVDGPVDSFGDVIAQVDAPMDGATEVEAGEACRAVDPDPDPGPSGYPMDGWTWTPHGVVLEDPAAAAFDGYLAPALLVRDDVLHVWWTKKTGLDHRIWHATSEDGIAFGEVAPVTGLDDGTVVAYPSVVVVDERFWMFYASGSIHLATSDNGVDWADTGVQVLGPGAPGAFDTVSLLYPSVLHEDGRFTMYYTGFDGQTHAIGRACSVDGETWERSAEAALVHGGPGAFDNRAVAQPAVLSGKDGLWLWFGGYDTSQTDPGPYRVGLASSTDGGVFDKRGVTWDLTPDGPEAHSTRDPSVVRWQDRVWMAYAGMGEDNRYRILTASSDNCVDG